MLTETGRVAICFFVSKFFFPLVAPRSESEADFLLYLLYIWLCLVTIDYYLSFSSHKMIYAPRQKINKKHSARNRNHYQADQKSLYFFGLVDNIFKQTGTWFVSVVDIG